VFSGVRFVVSSAFHPVDFYRTLTEACLSSP
jgi:hypothetical protein